MFESIIEGGKEEKRLAEERGSNHDGVPAICVIVDGGSLLQCQLWSGNNFRESNWETTPHWRSEQVLHFLFPKYPQGST